MRIKNKHISIIFLLLMLMSLFHGCIDEPNKNNNNEIKLLQLNQIGLNESEINNVEMLYEEYINESYTTDNLTGNQKTWTIIEGYFATFAGNTSRILESIIRFKTKAIASENFQLYKPFLLKNDLEEETSEPIGQNSFLLHGTTIIKNNETDIYVIVFYIGETLVTLKGFGITSEEIKTYANLIATRLQNLAETQL